MNRSAWVWLVLASLVAPVARGDEGLPGSPLLQAPIDRGSWEHQERVAGLPDLHRTSSGAVVPGPFRRQLRDRHPRAIRSSLRKGPLLEAAERPDADTFDLVFLGDGYAHGLRYLGRDVMGFDRGIVGDLGAAILGAVHSLDPDPEQAERWYRAAAARTPINTLALVRLADHILRRRAGDAHAEREADGLYARAATEGDAEAARKLALRIRGRDPSDPRWRALLLQAAFPAHHPEGYLDRVARAQQILVDLDEERFDLAHERWRSLEALDWHIRGSGNGLERDPNAEREAKGRLWDWLARRGEAGDAAAFYALYELSSMNVTVEIGDGWLERAAAGGHVPATVLLIQHLQGQGGRLRLEALPWLARLARLPREARTPAGQALLDRHEEELRAVAGLVDALSGR